MSGGLGNDPEVRAFLADQRTRYRALFTRLVLPGLEEPPALRVAIESFLSCLEGATLDWLSHRGISRAALHELIMTVAPVTPEAAAAADPSLAPHLAASTTLWRAPPA
jgi:hypothetical protein